MKLSILIAEDQGLVRKGLAMLILQYHPDWEVLEARDGLDTVNQVREHTPDLVLLDYKMPRMNGLEAATIIKKEFPGTQIIMISEGITEEILISTLTVGVKGYVPKYATEEELFNAIDMVMKGKLYLTGRMMDLVEQLSDKQIRKNDFKSCSFSPRENEVIDLIMQGCTSFEIAEKLNISKRTVDNHRVNILQRSGTRSVVELIQYVMRARGEADVPPPPPSPPPPPETDLTKGRIL